MHKSALAVPFLTFGLLAVVFGQACSGGFSALAPISQLSSTSGDDSSSTTGTAPGETPITTPITATPQVLNQVANRYDNLPSQSAVAVGVPITITLVPNGKWPSATLTPTLKSGSGTFNPTTVSVTAGSSTPATIQYTPTVTGEHNIQFSNSGALNNPYFVPLNVFASSAGSAQSLSALLARSYYDLHVFQRDAFSGNAAGFSLGSRGWGEVWVQIASIGGATNAIWARPYDAMSANASTTVGSGTALTNAAVQVYGAVSAAGNIRLLLPAQDAIVYWDLATDQAMTNPVRIAQRISVADKIGAMTRSQKASWGRGYATYGARPTGVTYNRVSIAEMSDMRYAPGADVQWSRQESGSADPAGSTPYDESPTAAAMEAGRLFASLKGVNLGVVADCSTGGDIDAFIAHDGSSGMTQMAAVTDSKFRYLTINMTGWSAVDSNYPSESRVESKTRYANFVAKMTAAVPSLAVIGGNTGDTGIFGNDGSNVLGYTRNQQVWRELSAQNPMVVSLEDYNWAGFYGGHSTQASRAQYARQDVRQLLSRDILQAGGFQTTSTGPTLATLGSVQAGTNVIKIAYSLNGAASLHNYQIREKADAITSVYSKDTASASDLASLFAVYPAGGYSHASGNLGQPIPITGVRYDGNYVYIMLAANATAAMTVHYASDFGVSGGTGLAASNPGGEGLVTIIGDNLDPLGIGLGQSMYSQLDITISVVN